MNLPRIGGVDHLPRSRVADEPTRLLDARNFILEDREAAHSTVRGNFRAKAILGNILRPRQVGLAPGVEEYAVAGSIAARCAVVQECARMVAVGKKVPSNKSRQKATRRQAA